MPYAFIHAPTGTLLSCVQRNGYKLAYYGLVLTESASGPLEISQALAEAGIAPDDPAGDVTEWSPLELTEHEAKMANVKLRNDPRRVAYYRDGVISATESAGNG
ncbi:hypothetical protein [Cohnella herbarum]|uniref:Uncharacterized protein n=1 Tax=Cohnella herbarum TaxID=2728023 RepID=A0A7Z2VGS8_9BACL|nr:hypothetical protein [Cohnella herbarum]QJD82589.1 hypothetical protein HH215_04870 [Cohnella herbarum]